MKRSFPRSIAPAYSPSAHSPSGDSLSANSVAANRVSPPSSERSEWPLDPSDFAAYYRFSPSALAVRECLRLRAVRKFDLAPPILDIGCGDGLFATLAYPGKQVW